MTSSLGVTPMTKDELDKLRGAATLDEPIRVETMVELIRLAEQGLVLFEHEDAIVDALLESINSRQNCKITKYERAFDAVTNLNRRSKR